MCDGCIGFLRQADGEVCLGRPSCSNLIRCHVSVLPDLAWIGMMIHSWRCVCRSQHTLLQTLNCPLDCPHRSPQLPTRRVLTVAAPHTDAELGGWMPLTDMRRVCAPDPRSDPQVDVPGPSGGAAVGRRCHLRGFVLAAVSQALEHLRGRKTFSSRCFEAQQRRWRRRQWGGRGVAAPHRISATHSGWVYPRHLHPGPADLREWQWQLQ